MIAVGFLEEQAVGQVAKKFPKTKFAIIDDSTSVKALKGLKNVEGLLYKERESGYLAGYLAGLFERADAKGLNSQNVMSTVGGIKIPPVDHYIAGFQAGAKAADPGVKLLNGYSGDFVAQDKCQGLAQQQIAQGSDIVFQVAGQLRPRRHQRRARQGRTGASASTPTSAADRLEAAARRGQEGVDQRRVESSARRRTASSAAARTCCFGVNENGAGIQGISSAVPADASKAKVNARQAKMKRRQGHDPDRRVVK